MAFLGPFDLSAHSSAFTSLSLHSDCSVSAMVSLRVLACFWSPSAGNGFAFDTGAKFEILCGQGVLWATLMLLCLMLAFPVPRESSTCVDFLSTFPLSWSGAVTGANTSFVYKMVLMAATLLAAQDGLAHGLCPSQGLARVGLASPWLEFTFSILLSVFLIVLFPVSVDVALLLSGKGFVHEEDKAFWKDFGMAGKACSLEDPFLTTGPIAVVTAAASWAAIGKYMKIAAAASCSALILVITLDSGFGEYVNWFWFGIVAAPSPVMVSLFEGDGSKLFLWILTLGGELLVSSVVIPTLVRVLKSTALGITTLSQEQADLHWGVGWPRGKSLGILEESLAAAVWNGQGAVSVAFHYKMILAVNCWLFLCAAALDIFFMHLISCSAAAAIMSAFAMYNVHALVDLCRVHGMIEPFVMVGSVLNSKGLLGITTLSKTGHDALRVECSPTRKAMPGVAAAASAAAIQVSFESVPGMPETEHMGSLSGGEKFEFQILVKGLNGRHIALPVFASMTVLELAALVHCRSLVLVEAFYLVKEGKRMGDNSTPSSLEASQILYERKAL